MKPLYLASASPRRHQLLGELGYSFEPVRVDVAEVRVPTETAGQYVTRLAHDKAQAGVSTLADPEALVIGADTIIELDGDVLEKPRDKAHFMAMFGRLSGRTHRVMTAVCIASTDGAVHERVTTEVTFAEVSPTQAEAYWNTGEPQDKAGGYAIQGKAGKFVRHIKGSYFAVVGLPLYETDQLIKYMQRQ